MTGTPTHDIDYRALDDPISAATVAAYREHSEMSSAPHPSARRLLGGSLFQLVWSLTLVVFGIVVSGLVLSTLSEGEWSAGAVVGVALAAAVLGGAFIAYAVWGVARRMRVGSSWDKRARLAQFAATNGFSYMSVSDPPSMSSSIIVHDRSSRATDRVIFSSSPHLEAGNFSSVVVAEGGTQRQEWGYIAIDLGVQLPHLVLRSFRVIRRYPAMTIPGEFTLNQSMQLEGDFSRHFALFAPEGYGRDALYVFTPDLMSLLLDEANELEMEIIDCWLLLYAPKPFDLASPTTVKRVLRIASAIGARAARQTQRYSDHRTEDAMVAPAGRRLRSGLGVFTVVASVLWIVVSIARAILMAQ